MCWCSFRASEKSGKPPTTCASIIRPVSKVVPLFARLSQQEQDHIFEPHSARRIVLATNVARPR